MKIRVAHSLSEDERFVSNEVLRVNECIKQKCQSCAEQIHGAN